jgi:predicted amidohydrolase YtcJ
VLFVSFVANLFVTCLCFVNFVLFVVNLFVFFVAAAWSAALAVPWPTHEAMNHSSLCRLVLVFALSSTGAAMEAPDTIFTGGAVYTLDPRNAVAEALAVRDGRIVAVGRNEAIAGLATARARKVDLAGGTVTPGLIDAHAHLAGLGRLRNSGADLGGAKSFDEVLDRVAARVRKSKPGEWVLGARWDQADWGEREFPTHERLSRLAPENPVLLTRVDGHSALANRRALDASGIRRDTPSPPGGEILKDRAGEPTGMLVDAAIGLVRRHVQTEASSLREDLLTAQQACLAAGLTGVHDAGIDLAELQLYRALCDEGQLALRVYAMLDAGEAVRHIADQPPLVAYGGGRLTARAVKCYLDGALGSRGAWLLAPYRDRPESCGAPGAPAESLLPLARLALKRGWQLCTHAIGDRANREALNLYEQVLKDRPAAEARWRIEHAQVVSPEDLPRFGRLGVIASMQFTHATSDMRWAEDRLGRDRLRGAYAWASLIERGARLAGGSDFPVENEKPLWGIYAAVTRQDHRGQPPGGWMARERLSREQAFRAFTCDAAFAAFEEQVKGTLEAGKWADFTVFDRDVMRCEPVDLLKTNVLMTVIGGRVAYRK